MDAETDLFVQAFWVKCRETIRPTLDDARERLSQAGHDAHISTLEFSPGEENSPDAAPALLLTVHRTGEPGAWVLRYRGDVPTREIEISLPGERPVRVDMATIDDATVKRHIAGTFGGLLKS
ncbi:MAG: hypothetical protein EPO67_03050 [Reyranella sp.]|jgi:hypothetical protein|nr:MAG: hypothetical protein EPO67_03050 [Reyranella sp.]